LKVAEATVENETKAGPLKADYLDVIVSDVKTNSGFSFSVQILNTEGEHDDQTPRMIF
jgi:staphylococcal nuclease domain-containing protein 1